MRQQAEHQSSVVHCDGMGKSLSKRETLTCPDFPINPWDSLSHIGFPLGFFVSHDVGINCLKSCLGGSSEEALVLVQFGSKTCC